MKTRVYLDNCCFNRPFDDQSNAILQLETIAILHIQAWIRNGDIELAWSSILERENNNSPHKNQRENIAQWKELSVVDIGANSALYQQGRAIEKYGIHEMDALHIACAIKARCQFFLTTDKKILNKKIIGMTMLNPLNFIQKMETTHENEER